MFMPSRSIPSCHTLEHPVICSQVRASDRNDPDSSGRNYPDSDSILGSTFATNVSSNFIIWEKLLHFGFGGQKLFVTINLIDWIDFKTSWRVLEAKNLWEIMNIFMENTMQKWAYVKIPHAELCIQTCEPQNKKLLTINPC